MSKSSKTALLIDKSGTVKEIQIKHDDIPNNLYKKAGFKTPEDFSEQFVWELNLNETGGFSFSEQEPNAQKDNYSISIFGKKVGKNSKNTYGFPPPLEDTHFYGNCILVNNRGSITLKEWNNLFEVIYEKYDAEDDEDDAKEDSSSETEDNEDEAEEDEEQEDEIDEMDEDEMETDKNGKPKRKNGKKGGKKTNTEFDMSYVEEQFLDCEMELEPEEYLE